MGGPGPVLVYSMYDWDLERFGRILGPSLPEVALHYAGSPAQAEPYLADAEILYGWGFSAALMQRMPKLRWVQKMGAGVDDVVGDWPSERDILLTRTDGRLIASRMVEYVVAAILRRTLQLDHARVLQAERKWTYYEAGTIRRLTVGVAGLGEIGAEIARALRALGATVLGWRRSAAANEVATRVFVGDDALGDFARLCDVLVLVLPLTQQTRGIIDVDVLGKLRPGAHVINVGRGGVLDEAALLAAIADGRVGHATLDVFRTEPLPQDHPFWGNGKITITPHVCGPLVPEDVAPHFIDNYRAFAIGKPLRNVVDPQRQY